MSGLVRLPPRNTPRSQWRSLLNWHESGMMEQLSTDALTHVLSFLDIPARVKLARCNTTVQQRVYQECQQAWVVIDFGNSRRLTDYQLSRLFIRVNARQVTKELLLHGCDGIQGSGLTPLRNSRVFERVQDRRKRQSYSIRVHSSEHDSPQST